MLRRSLRVLARRQHRMFPAAEEYLEAMLEGDLAHAQGLLETRAQEVGALAVALAGGAPSGWAGATGNASCDESL